MNLLLYFVIPKWTLSPGGRGSAGAGGGEYISIYSSSLSFLVHRTSRWKLDAVCAEGE